MLRTLHSKLLLQRKYHKNMHHLCIHRSQVIVFVVVVIIKDGKRTVFRATASFCRECKKWTNYIRKQHKWWMKCWLLMKKNENILVDGTNCHTTDLPVVLFSIWRQHFLCEAIPQSFLKLNNCVSLNLTMMSCRNVVWEYFGCYIGRMN